MKSNKLETSDEMAEMVVEPNYVASWCQQAAVGIDLEANGWRSSKRRRTQNCVKVRKTESKARGRRLKEIDKHQALDYRELYKGES